MKIKKIKLNEWHRNKCSLLSLYQECKHQNNEKKKSVFVNNWNLITWWTVYHTKQYLTAAILHPSSLLNCCWFFQLNLVLVLKPLEERKFSWTYFSNISVEFLFCRKHLERDKERSKSTLKLQKVLKQWQWNNFINTKSMILNEMIQKVSKKEVNKVSAVCTILDKRTINKCLHYFAIYAQSSCPPPKKNELGFVNYSCHFPINLQYYSRQWSYQMWYVKSLNIYHNLKKRVWILKVVAQYKKKKMHVEF